MIKYIFGPINHFGFIFYAYLFCFIADLYARFIMFFDMSMEFSFYLPLYILILEILIICTLVFKRLLDIFDKVWKAIVFALISVILLIIFLFISFPTLTIDGNSITMHKQVILWLCPIYSMLLILFLTLKNGKKTPFFSINWRIAIKYIILLACIFGLQLLSNSFTTMMSSVDYRMYPTFEIQDSLLVNKIINSTSLKREDVVCIRDNKFLTNPLRIIGLPNEEIKLDANKIYINGVLYSDKFAFFSSSLKPINYQERIQLDNNSYFLMGDNRYYDEGGKILTKDRNGNKIWKSINDGKIYLTINKSDIFGKVIAVNYKLPCGTKAQRENTHYAFAIKNKKFEFNPSSTFIKIFGEP